MTIRTPMRRYRAIAVGAMAVALLSAGLPAMAEGPSGAPISGSDLAGTLNVWGGSEQQVEAPLIALFNKRYPNVQVNYRQIQYDDYVAALRTGLAANDGPDVFENEEGGIATAFGQFTSDLTPVIEATLGPDWQTKVNELTVQPFLQDGRLTALSAGVQGGGTIEYNQSMLDELGLQFPTTIDEWKTVCDAIAAADKVCVAMGGKDAWANTDVFHAVANSIAPGKFAQAVSGDIPWNDPDLVTAFGAFQSLFTNIFQRGAAAATTYPDAMNMFLAGDAAMIPMGAWDAANFKTDFLAASISGAGLTNPPFTVMLAPMPDFSGSGRETGLFATAANSWSVNAKSTNQDLADAYVAIKTITPEAAQIWVDKLNIVPMLNGIQPSEDVASELVDPAAQLPVAVKLMGQVGASTDRRAIDDPELVTVLGDALAQLATGSPAQGVADALEASAPNP